MKTFLTIDWDYFVPENLKWRFYQEEIRLYLDRAWKRKINHFLTMRTNGEQENFWVRLNLKKDIPYYVSDSHLDAYRLKELEEINRVVIVDAHHDIFNPDNDEIDCATWLGEWLGKSKYREVIWVKPYHSTCVDINPKYRNQVTIINDISLLPNLDYSCVHVCRSGCWTPPWTDQEFIDFVKAYGNPVILNEKWINPMVPRWLIEDYWDAFNTQASKEQFLLELDNKPLTMEFILEFQKQGLKIFMNYNLAEIEIVAKLIKEKYPSDDAKAAIEGLLNFLHQKDSKDRIHLVYKLHKNLFESPE